MSMGSAKETPFGSAPIALRSQMALCLCCTGSSAVNGMITLDHAWKSERPQSYDRNISDLGSLVDRHGRSDVEKRRRHPRHKDAADTHRLQMLQII